MSQNEKLTNETMRPIGYSPYHQKPSRKGISLKFPNIPRSVKKWLAIIGGILVGIFIIVYLSLGELRFFANHYLALTFFNKNYLILLQNNYEMRPTGGFITAYGEISATMGFMGDPVFHNSYKIDTSSYVTPPFPHEKFLKNEWYEGYTFRDANWDPNFPVAAATLIDFYQKKFPEKDVDGIIVVNFSMIEDLVGKLGGITVNDKKLDKNNLFAFITHDVNNVDRHNEEALMDRKDVLGELAAPLISKAKWHPFKTRDVIVNALHSKDMVLWFKGNGLQKRVEKKGWANHFELPEASDFLAVNIANLGSKKADRYLRKEVHHYVNISKELPEVTTEIVLRYPSNKSFYADDYKGYLRLYIPGEAEIKENLLDSNVIDETPFKVIEEEIILPAGGKTTFSFTYALPRNLLNAQEYRLRLVKQPGDEKFYDIAVETPQDSFTESDDFTVRENQASFNGTIMGDRDFTLTVLPDTLPPYPIEQVFSDLSTISVYWNEPMDTATGNDALNYIITDTNQIEPNVTDEVSVVYAEIVEGSVSKLEVEGITDQPLERYQVEIKGLQDASGNTTDPISKIITVVQRLEDAPVTKKKVEEVEASGSSPFNLNP